MVEAVTKYLWKWLPYSRERQVSSLQGYYVYISLKKFKKIDEQKAEVR